MEPVTDAQLELAQLAWSGFRSETPEPWVGLLRVSTHVLPFLRLAIRRLLEELPHPVSGLSRTEWTILSLIEQGAKSPAGIYEAFPISEEALFMGDLSFYHALDTLGAGGAPLIAGFNGLTFFSFDAGRGTGRVSCGRIVMHASRHHDPGREIGRLAAQASGPLHRRVLPACARAVAVGSCNRATLAPACAMK